MQTDPHDRVGIWVPGWVVMLFLGVVGGGALLADVDPWGLDPRLVVILDRRIEVQPSGENDWGGAMKQTHYQSRHILSVRYETGATIEKSEVVLAGAFVTWKRVAGEVAKDAEKWARDNRR